MANGEYEIDEYTFRKMSVDSQNWIMYKTFNAHRLQCDKRLCGIEEDQKLLKSEIQNKKFSGKIISAASGAFAGLGAAIGLWISKS